MCGIVIESNWKIYLDTLFKVLEKQDSSVVKGIL